MKRVQAPANYQQLRKTIQNFAAKHGIKNEISQIKYQEYPEANCNTFVTVEDDDDLELGIAMVMSTSDDATKAITFIVSFEKELP
jgi:hypothetical protein